MRNLLCIIIMVALYGCDKEQDIAGITLDGRSFGNNEPVDPVAMCTEDVCYILGITKQNREVIRIKLSDLAVGTHELGIAKNERFVWFDSYYSDFGDASGGYVDIQRNDGKTISGAFNVNVGDPRNDMTDEVVGTLNEIPIVSWDDEFHGEANGLIGNVEKAFNEVILTEDSLMYNWFIMRPGPENIALSINKDSLMQGEYKLHDARGGGAGYAPILRYEMGSDFYLNFSDTQNMTILEHIEDRKTVICELSCILDNTDTGEKIELDQVKLKLIYE